MIIPSRRGFIGGMIAALAAPAIVRAESLMPVRAPKLIVPEFRFYRAGLDFGANDAISCVLMASHDGNTWTVVAEPAVARHANSIQIGMTSGIPANADFQIFGSIDEPTGGPAALYSPHVPPAGPPAIQPL